MGANTGLPRPYLHNSSPATATTSRRRATKHVPRVSPYSPASIDPGFVEIGLVQLSQSVKTTNVTHTLTDTQADRRTDRLIKYNGTLYAPLHEEAFLSKGKNGLGRFAPSALPHYDEQIRSVYAVLLSVKSSMPRLKAVDGFCLEASPRTRGLDSFLYRVFAIQNSRSFPIETIYTDMGQAPMS